MRATGQGWAGGAAVTARRKRPGRVADPLGHAKLLADLQESRRVQDALRSQVRRIADERNERERQREEAIAQLDLIARERDAARAEREQARRELAAERAKPAPEPKELLAELAMLRGQVEELKASASKHEQELASAWEHRLDTESLSMAQEEALIAMGKVIRLGKIERERACRRFAEIALESTRKQ